MKTFLYTPRSGSKIFAQSVNANRPKVAVETLQNGSHIVHYTCPIFSFAPARRLERFEVRQLLEFLARKDIGNLIAWDEQGCITFAADMEIAEKASALATRHGRALMIRDAVDLAKEGLEIWPVADHLLWLPPKPLDGTIEQGEAARVEVFPAHEKHSSYREGSRVTFGDLDWYHATHLLKRLLEEIQGHPYSDALHFVSVYMDGYEGFRVPEDGSILEYVREFFGDRVGSVRSFFADWKTEEVEEVEESEDPGWHEEAVEVGPSEEEKAAEAEAAAQKKKEEESLEKIARDGEWRRVLRTELGALEKHPWFAHCFDHAVLTREPMKIREELFESIARRYGGWSDMWWRSPAAWDRILSALKEDSYNYPTVPIFPMRPEGDAPSEEEWSEWLFSLTPCQFASFAKWLKEADSEILFLEEYGMEAWPFNANADDALKEKIEALSETFPFPFPHKGLTPHPQTKDRYVLGVNGWHDFYLRRGSLRIEKLRLLRRHFSMLERMAEIAASA